MNPHPFRCEVDRYVKSMAVGGALLLVANAPHRRRHWGRSCATTELAAKLRSVYDQVIGSSGGEESRCVRGEEGGERGVRRRRLTHTHTLLVTSPAPPRMPLPSHPLSPALSPPPLPVPAHLPLFSLPPSPLSSSTCVLDLLVLELQRLLTMQAVACPLTPTDTNRHRPTNR